MTPIPDNSSFPAVHTTTEPLEGNYFVAAYPPFSCWTPEATDHALGILKTPPAPQSTPPLGLYVHIPFCAKRCDFCYYLSFDDRLQQVDEYVEALSSELSHYAKMAAIAGRRPTVIYFGGGTPSLLSAEQIVGLLKSLQDLLPWDQVEEATFECAPKTVTAEKLRVLRESGITRLSLGAQQLDDDILGQNGRIHLTEDVHRAFELAKAQGFPVINIDLIVGLVGETEASFHKSLQQTIQLAPQSVTIYQLEIPFNTPLYAQLRAGPSAPTIADWNTKRERLKRAFETLERHGYHVTSGYAAVQDPARHRFVYQQQQYHGADLLGLGVASFSYLAGVHFQNRTSIDDYLKCVREGALPIERAFALDQDERMTREFLLQLKLGRLSADYFRRKFATEITERFGPQLQQLIKAQWITLSGDTVELTRDGLLRVDRILPTLYPARFRTGRYS